MKRGIQDTRNSGIERATGQRSAGGPITRTAMLPLPSHKMKMAKLGELKIDREKRQFEVPVDMARLAPKFHANYTLVVTTEQEVSLIFCIKEETVTTSDASIAIPQACCFLSLQEAQNLSDIIARSVSKVQEAMKQEMMKEARNDG